MLTNNYKVDGPYPVRPEFEFFDDKVVEFCTREW